MTTDRETLFAFWRFASSLTENEGKSSDYIWDEWIKSHPEAALAYAREQQADAITDLRRLNETKTVMINSLTEGNEDLSRQLCESKAEIERLNKTLREYATFEM
jgi:hypothetical protein